MGTREAGHLCHVVKTDTLWSFGGFPSHSHLLWQGLIYPMAPEAPLFLGMSTRPKAFLEPPGVFGQWPGALLLC